MSSMARFLARHELGCPSHREDESTDCASIRLTLGRKMDGKLGRERCSKRAETGPGTFGVFCKCAPRGTCKGGEATTVEAGKEERKKKASVADRSTVARPHARQSHFKSSMPSVNCGCFGYFCIGRLGGSAPRLL